MISEEYLGQLKELHASREDFGKYSSRWAGTLMDLCGSLGTQDVLDYGCGKGELNLHMPFEIKGYDPAIERFSERPGPADIVVCTDVLEHIEPEHLTAVLDDLRNLTRRCMLVNIATREASKTLPDGRNAHLIVAPAMYWLKRLDDQSCWKFHVITANEHEATCVLLKEGA